MQTILVVDDEPKILQLARDYLEHAGHLEFPFRRYQIQPAWRGERPQEGRYRQFNQADVDVVGRDELPFHHDIEVMRVMVEALDALPLPPLRTLSNRVTYSIERWADESAAAVCGDRRLVAVTLGNVALHRHPATVSGFAGLGVASRMGALLEPPVGNPRRPLVIAMWSAVVMTAGLSLFQLHHVDS